MQLQSQIYSNYKPIKSYAAIGNTQTAALVNLDGSIDWCCLPRFDSPSIFAALLDAKRGGRFRISPTSAFQSSQEYLKNTNLLKTTFQTQTGVVELLDFMPCYKEDRETIGLSEIHRRLRCTQGTMMIEIEFQPKPNYARSEPEFKVDSNYLTAYTANETLLLTAGDSVNPLSATSKLNLQRGEPIWVDLLFTRSQPPPEWEPQSEIKLAKTTQYWRDWIRTCKYNGPWSEAVRRSALTLKLLSYSPTGALVAAATTSLPETIRGPRNWDYRYTWIRDSSYTLWALKRLGFQREGKIFIRWLRAKYRRGISQLQIMSDVEGNGDLAESELPHLEGYMQSHPIRIGNAACKQFQLDIYGEVLDAIYFLHKHGEGVPKIEYELFVRGLANFICGAYKLPDSGIWEFRTTPKHFVYSKLWCWVGLDRAISLADEMKQTQDAMKWRHSRQLIEDEIMTKGWSEKNHCFRQHYETDEPDAANLLMPLVGFISPTHPKFRENLEATIRELSLNGLVYRYRTKDNLRGQEGTFTLCTLWLTQCLAKMGRVTEATTLFEKVLQQANHVGLYSEQIDPTNGDALGNFPQAFTHLNLINAALDIDAAINQRT
jgi:GH15 family glucan-1,4-alpha-glucosidase